MRLVAWAALYAVSGAGGFVLGSLISGAAGIPWIALVVIVWAVLTLIGKMGDVVDRVDGYGRTPLRMNATDLAVAPESWERHNGVWIRPEMVPARVPSRGTLIGGLIVILMAGWIAGLIAGVS